MSVVLGILGAAVLFAAFGLVSRERRRPGGCGTCHLTERGCAGCPERPEGVESEHAER